MCPDTWYRWHLSLLNSQMRHCHCCAPNLNMDLLSNTSIASLGIPNPWYVLRLVVLLFRLSWLFLYGFIRSTKRNSTRFPIPCVVLEINPHPWLVRICILPSSSKCSLWRLPFCFLRKVRAPLPYYVLVRVVHVRWSQLGFPRRSENAVSEVSIVLDIVLNFPYVAFAVIIGSEHFNSIMRFGALLFSILGKFVRSTYSIPPHLFLIGYLLFVKFRKYCACSSTVYIAIV